MGEKKDSLYLFQATQAAVTSNNSEPFCFPFACTSIQNNLWHFRMGHPSQAIMDVLKYVLPDSPFLLSIMLLLVPYVL